VIGNATLYHGDCLEILPTLPKVDAVVTDPPYGMGYRSNHNSSRVGAGAAMTRKDGDFSPIHGDDAPFNPSPLLALQIPSIIWGANYFSNQLPSGTRWLVWDKLAGKTPVPCGSDVELAWTSTKGPSRIFQHLWRGIMRAGEENVCNGGKDHPNQKPQALMRWCVEMTAGSVLDPFMGSGTTGVACMNLGRKFVGIEIERKYFDIACERIDNAQRQARMFA
jgi:site-specific DNA-methyltransferase (adenine-specific)